MRQEQRDEFKKQWFSDCDSIREIPMPNDAKFFVGQTVMHNGYMYEIIGYYDYYGKYPAYLAVDYDRWLSLTGIPFTVQDEMYLKSEEHLRAKIVRMNFKHK